MQLILTVTKYNYMKLKHIILMGLVTVLAFLFIKLFLTSLVMFIFFLGFASASKSAEKKIDQAELDYKQRVKKNSQSLINAVR